MAARDDPESTTELQQWHRQRQQQLQQLQQQQEFVRRLEKLYFATCRRLTTFRETMEFSQQVVLWRRPAVSVAVFLLVHIAFW